MHDLLEATKECKTVIELLRAERLDESVWDELYQSALDLSEPFDIVENMRKTDYQSQSPCRHAETVSWVMCFRASCVFVRHLFSYVMCFRTSCVFVRHVFSCVMCFRASCVFVLHVFSYVM